MTEFPRDLDAERSACGAAMLGAAAEVLERCKPADFFDPRHRAIAGAVKRLHGRGEPIDELTVAGELGATGDLEHAGGSSFVRELVDQMPTAANAAHHAGRVCELSMRRAIMRSSSQAASLAADTSVELERVIESASDGLRRAAGEQVRRGLRGCWSSLDPTWLKHEPPARSYLLRTRLIESAGTVDEPRGFMPVGRVGMLVGAGAAGKSWAYLQLALCVATGRPWMDTYTVDEPGRVLLALGEEEESELRSRLFHAGRLLGLTDDEHDRAAANLVPLALSGTDVALSYGLDELKLAYGSKPVPPGLHETPFARDLREHLNKGGEPWRLLIFDPISRFAPLGIETDNSAATRFVQICETFTRVNGNPTVLVAHHTNKTARSGDTSAIAARGSSALTDGVRWQANLEVLERFDSTLPDFARLRVTKNNYGAPTPPLMLCRVREHDGALRPATVGEIRAYADAEQEARAEAHAEKERARHQGRARARAEDNPPAQADPRQRRLV